VGLDTFGTLPALRYRWITYRKFLSFFATAFSAVLDTFGTLPVLRYTWITYSKFLSFCATTFNANLTDTPEKYGLHVT
jgi:hypothetical protein